MSSLVKNEAVCLVLSQLNYEVIQLNNGELFLEDRNVQESGRRERPGLNWISFDWIAA